MTKTNDHVIRSPEALREVVGDALPVVALKILDRLDEFGRSFLARCPFLVLSTSDMQGNVDSSPKGDAPGFVLIEDDGTIVIPDRPGNKLAYGHLNILTNPHVGLLCLIPGTSETLRINGRAELSSDPALLERLAARGRPATLATRVRIDQCFFHCGKAFIRANLWKPETWGERHRVSFGEMLEKKAGGGADAARSIDQFIETDYRDNL
jgi:PPOX class probable FMN-dependent enzyme